MTKCLLTTDVCLWEVSINGGLTVYRIVKALLVGLVKPYQLVSSCCVRRHFTLTVPLPTQENKWVSANYWGNLTTCLGGGGQFSMSLRATRIPTIGADFTYLTYGALSSRLFCVNLFLFTYSLFVVVAVRSFKQVQRTKLS